MTDSEPLTFFVLSCLQSALGLGAASSSHGDLQYSTAFGAAASAHSSTRPQRAAAQQGEEARLRTQFVEEQTDEAVSNLIGSLGQPESYILSKEEVKVKRKEFQAAFDQHDLLRRKLNTYQHLEAGVSTDDESPCIGLPCMCVALG